MSRFKKTVIKIKNTYFLFYCFPKISSNDLPKKKKEKFFRFCEISNFREEILVFSFSSRVSCPFAQIWNSREEKRVAEFLPTSFSPRVSPREFLLTSFSRVSPREITPRVRFASGILHCALCARIPLSIAWDGSVPGSIPRTQCRARPDMARRVVSVGKGSPRRGIREPIETPAGHFGLARFPLSKSAKAESPPAERFDSPSPSGQRFCRATACVAKRLNPEDDRPKRPWPKRVKPKKARQQCREGARQL